MIKSHYVQIISIDSMLFIKHLSKTMSIDKQKLW